MLLGSPCVGLYGDDSRIFVMSFTPLYTVTPTWSPKVCSRIAFVCVCVFCVCVCVCVVDQGALGPVTTRWPLRPEGLRGQPRPRHPCVMHHPALAGPPRTLGKTARTINPKIFSWRFLARIPMQARRQEQSTRVHHTHAHHAPAARKGPPPPNSARSHSP